MSKYKAITEWIDEVVKVVDTDKMTKLSASINSLDAEKVGTYSLFTDVNIATLDEYVDGSSIKACYVTLRLVLPYSNSMSPGGNEINFESQSFASAVKDKLEAINIDENTDPGLPVLGDNLVVTEIENLDNDPDLEDISEDATKAIYSFQFRVVYLDNTNVRN